METCGSCVNADCSVTILVGYPKFYYVSLNYIDTGAPFDLTGATDINVAHPGAQLFPILENFAQPAGTTGDTLALSTQVLNLASTVGLTPGLSIAGAGIPAGTWIAAISGTTLTLSQPATATATAVAFTFGNTNVTVIGAPGAGRIKIVLPAIDSAALQVNPYPTQYQNLQVSVVNGSGAYAFLIPGVLNIIPPTYGVV